jgi:RHS repeat-associated protein
LPSGTTQRFGVSSESRVEAGQRIFAWHVEEEVDVFGNRVSYFYEKDGQLPYLTRVEYNRRTGAARNEVRFEWQPRPDVLTDYKPGFKTQVGRRLTNIRVSGKGAALWRYELQYAMGTGLSLLSAVRMYGEDDTSSLPALTFEYTGMASGMQVKAMTQGPALLPGSNDDSELTDFDGDGFPDIVLASTAQHQWARNVGGLRFAAPVPIPNAPNVSLATAGVELADMNADGVADLLAKTSANAFRYYPATGKGAWAASVALNASASFQLEDGATRLADLDFDKFPDVMRVTNNTVSWWRNNGQGDFEAPVTLSPLPGQTTVDFSDGRFKLVDVNGDRLVDIAFLRSGSILYWPGLGRGQFDTPVALTNVPDVGAAREAQLQLADFTGDGLPDLFLPGVNQCEFWPLTLAGQFGAKQTVATPFANASVTQTRLGDMNGNGSLDVVFLTPSAAPENRVVYVELQPGVRPNLLLRVKNSLGMERRLAWTSSADEFQAAQEEGIPWATRVPFATQLVAGVEVTDSRGNSNVTAYRYADGYYAASTREFRGFARVTQSDEGDAEDAALQSTFVFDVGLSDEALKGREKERETRSGPSLRFMKKTTQLQPRVYATGVDGTKVTGVEVAAETDEVFEGQNTPVEIKRAFTYDEFQSVLTETHFGRSDVSGDETVKKKTYAHNPQRWVLGRVAEEWVESTTGQRFTAMRHYYDGNAFEGLPLGQTQSGVETRNESWVSGDSWLPGIRVKRDEFGNVVQSLTPRGAVRDIELDDIHTFAVAEALQLGNGKALRFKVSYKNANGLVSSFTDSNGAVSVYTWDALQRLTGIVRPGDKPEAPSLTFRYLLASPVSTVESLTRFGDAMTTASVTREAYDGLGRKVATLHEAENGQWVVEDLKRYSRRGATLQEWDNYFASSPEISATPAGVDSVSHVYDGLGRLVRTNFPDGTHSEMRRGPLWVESWDAADVSTDSPHKNTPLRHVFDGLGRLTQTVEMLGASSLTTSFAFDAAGRRQGVTDAKGNTVSYLFDGLGRLTQVTHPEAGVRQYGYDEDGNGIRSIDALGQAVVRAYDFASRIQTETYLDTGMQPAGVTQYFYDEKSEGDLSRVVDLAGEESFEYDARRRLTSSARSFEGKQYVLGQTYDNANHVVGLKFPDDTTVEYVFNKRGLVERIAGFVTAVEYDAKGFAKKRTLANGVVSEAAYDAHDRVKLLRTVKGNVQLQSLQYSYDAVGALTEVRDEVRSEGQMSGSWRFSYDSLTRLVEADGPAGKMGHQYDAVGNLLQKSDMGAYAYENAVRAGVLTAVGGRALTTNANGQMTEALGRTFTWDARGELRKVESALGTTEYVYDYTGQRTVKKVTGGQKPSTTLYLDKYAEVRSGVLVKYVFLGDARVARVGGETPKMLKLMSSSVSAGVSSVGLAAVVVALLAMAARKKKTAVKALATFVSMSVASCTCAPPVARDTVFYVDNHLGSAVMLTDFEGKVLGESNFDVWGQALAGTDEAYGFVGSEYDAEAGLQYLNARYYDVRLGRFVSPDLSLLAGADEGQEDPQVLNVYSYARNTPTVMRDKSGKLPHVLAGALLGGLVGGSVYFLKASMNGEQATWRGALAATAGGAVAGAVGAATGGLGLLASGGVAAAAGGIVERGINTGSVTAAADMRQVSADFAIGVASAAVVKGGGVVARKVGGEVAERAGPAVKKVLEGLKSECQGGACKVTSSGCFVAGTLVLLASGVTLPIEQVQVGDVVMSMNVAKGMEPEAHVVTNAWSLLAPGVVDVTVEGEGGARETVSATAEHPFLRGDGEFVEAARLREGDAVRQVGGGVGKVVGLERRGGVVRVFNFEVEGVHSYAVGQAGVVVHNAGCAGEAPDFVVTPGGTAYKVPKGAVGPTPVVNPSGKVTGAAFTTGQGGANGQVSTMRLMDPVPPKGSNPGYPKGYIKYENAAKQGVDGETGKTISNAVSHHAID